MKNLKNLHGWLKFNENMDASEEKKCDCGQEDCGICNEKEENANEAKKAPKMKADKKEDKKGDKKEAPKKGGEKKELSAAQKKLPWNKDKK